MGDSTPSPLRLVVFDMDGTLIDSGDVIAAAMQSAFDSEALPRPSDRDIRRIVGLELYEAVRRLAPELEEAVNKRVGDAYKNAFVSARSAGGGEGAAEMYPGALAALERLNAGEALMGVATGKARRGLDHTLEAHDLGRFFVTTQTCTENPGKPHPGMIESACRETGVEARDVVMVGDTVFDIEMAMNAGAQAIGVNWGYHETEELLAAGASVVLERFDGLDAALSMIWGAER
ncbi:MAG: HAD-IA family hydrolase [Rhodobacteraceae bacterium]|nr:HAD-IA family hydrolase [Paracoccaceae bacterium]